MSSKGQITLPKAALRATGIDAGDELQVQIEENHLILKPEISLAERRIAAIDKIAGSMPGVFQPGHLDRLRNEWR
ncbi:MAG: AbrB/MazE/SpoVT family DNA-binding domain-containing protein [Candidatus Dormibacteraceae bacterium]